MSHPAEKDAEPGDLRPEKPARPTLEPLPRCDEATMIGIGLPRPPELDTPGEVSNGAAKTLLFGDAMPVPGFSGVAEHESDLRETTRMDRSQLEPAQSGPGEPGLADLTDTVTMTARSADAPAPSSDGFNPRARVTATALDRVLPPSSALATPLATSTPIVVRPLARRRPEERPHGSRTLSILAIAVAASVTIAIFIAMPRLLGTPPPPTPAATEAPRSRDSRSTDPVEARSGAEVEATPATKDASGSADAQSDRGRLTIESAPPGARVLLVEEANEAEPRLVPGPFPLTIEVPRSGFKVIATRAGHYDFIEPIAFGDGDERTIRVELYRRPSGSAKSPATKGEPAGEAAGHPASEEPDAAPDADAVPPTDDDIDLGNPYVPGGAGVPAASGDSAAVDEGIDLAE